VHNDVGRSQDSASLPAVLSWPLRRITDTHRTMLGLPGMVRQLITSLVLDPDEWGRLARHAVGALRGPLPDSLRWTIPGHTVVVL